MAIKDSILRQFDHIVAGTRSVLEAVPTDKLDWRPHEKSFTLGELAGHLANLPMWTAPTLEHDVFDVAPAGDAPPPSPTYDSTDAILAGLDANAAAAREAIANASDERFMSDWTMQVAGVDRFTMPKLAVLNGFILHHLIHHRGQLTVYLRLLDVPVPQTFGPTADHPDM